MDFQKEIARSMLKIGAVGFKPKEPITFKSGIISPVYCDNRKFPFHPAEWKKVIEGFAALIEQDKIDADIIAGVEAAGIPHSAALGFYLSKPSVFVRKQAKEHGLKKRVEGGEVSGKKVILVEDLVTTGSSSLSVIQALRDEGAQIEDCLIIITYGFQESALAFAKAKVKLHALTTFPVVLAEAVAMGTISQEEKAVVSDWLLDPYNWAKKYGHE